MLKGIIRAICGLLASVSDATLMDECVSQRLVRRGSGECSVKEERESRDEERAGGGLRFTTDFNTIV